MINIFHVPPKCLFYCVENQRVMGVSFWNFSYPISKMSLSLFSCTTCSRDKITGLKEEKKNPWNSIKVLHKWFFSQKLHTNSWRESGKVRPCLPAFQSPPYRQQQLRKMLFLISSFTLGVKMISGGGKKQNWNRTAWLQSSSLACTLCEGFPELLLVFRETTCALSWLRMDFQSSSFLTIQLQEHVCESVEKMSSKHRWRTLSQMNFITPPQPVQLVTMVPSCRGERKHTEIEWLPIWNAIISDRVEWVRQFSLLVSV